MRHDIKMKQKLCILLFLMLSVPLHAAEKPPTAVWVKNMTGLYRSLGEILIQISDTQNYYQGKNRARLEKEVKVFTELAQETARLSKDPKKSADADLSLTLYAPMFAQEAKRAQAELKAGHGDARLSARREYARTLLKSMTNYCIACHTRNSSGPHFYELGFQFPVAEKSKLSEMDRAEFYAATRQFDLSQKAFIKILSDSAILKKAPLEWERAARYALAVAVRVKKNPEQAIEVIQKVLSAEQAPFFMKKDAEQWMKSAQDWKAEKPVSQKTPNTLSTLNTEEDYRREVARLLSRARTAQKAKSTTSASSDVVLYARSGDVDYLRASALIHEWLQKFPITASSKDAQTSEALFMAGVCYEVLKEFNLDGMHELYYETCIRRSPHTPTAEACYRQYEQSVHFGYTGSGGTHLPPEMETKLNELERLSLNEAAPHVQD